MKSVSFTIVAATLATSALAFQPPGATTGTHNSRYTTALYEYIPSGFTKESWQKFKAEEAKKKATQKNLGRLGPKGFQSRSFQSFQEALERGEATHLLPVLNAKERLAKGEIKPEDVPVSIRDASW